MATLVNEQQQIVENLTRVRERIAAAAARSGRSPDDVLLLPVTKYVSAEVAAWLLDGTIGALAESRPQQLWEKAAALPNVEWHLVGHLQRNKVRRTLPLVTLIHSVDSLRLLRAIDREAAETAAQARLLLEVNTSGEEEKHGFLPDEVCDVLRAAETLAHVSILGLMTMARRGGGDEARRSFAMLRELRTRCREEFPAQPLDQLSMGMSGDFEEAIEEGATIVRIGSSLFEGIAR